MKITHFPPILSLVIAAFLVLAGYQWGRLGVTTSPTPGGTATVSTATAPGGLDFSLFWEAWNMTHAKFFGEIDDTKLTEGAIRGMVGALEDPYTVYLDPEAAKELNDGLEGVIYGIGAEVAVKNRRLLIVAPLPDSPAEKAGLKPQDEIQKIDGAGVGDLTFVEAVRKIRGEAGTTVTLTIFRAGEEASREVVVAREKIEVKSVTSEIRADGIGVLTISAFHEDTTVLLKAAVDEFLAAKVTGVVLDLRGNPGGLLSEGISVTSMFLREGVVVKRQHKDKTSETYEVTIPAKLPDIPLVVLIDGGSASASEIVAGALQDHGRAKLIGVTTFGKGSVQELEDLRNGGQLKVTVAEWLTPNGRLINGTGITPDIVIEVTAEDEAASRDPQLEKAIEVLKD